MKSDQWLNQYFQGEFFSGHFDHLKELVSLIHPKIKSKIITIAGTNGKGQTIRTLAKMLELSKQDYLCFTSPHLETVRERFDFNGSFIDDEELVFLFKELKEMLAGRNVSYYEFLFLSFVLLAKKKNPKFILLEVGLGGRLDATNALDADLCAITSIARDHQEFLGKRYDGILKEKLGIIRPSCHLKTSFNLDYLNQQTEAFIKTKNIKWEKVKTDTLSFSDSNINLAKALYRELLASYDVPEYNYSNIAKRRSLVVHGASYSFYPSHNLDGVRKLVQFLSSGVYNNTYSQCFMSFSEREERELIMMVNLVQSLVGKDHVFLLPFEHNRSCSEDKLNIIAKKTGAKVVTRHSQYFQKISKDKGPILVTGSNYFIADLFQFLESTRSK